MRSKKIAYRCLTFFEETGIFFWLRYASEWVRATKTLTIGGRMRAFTVYVGRRGRPTVKDGVRIVDRSKRGKAQKWALRLGSTPLIGKGVPLRRSTVDIPAAGSCFPKIASFRDRHGAMFLTDVHPESRQIDRGQAKKALVRYCLRPPHAEGAASNTDAILLHLNTHCPGAPTERGGKGVWRTHQECPHGVMQEIATAWCAHMVQRKRKAVLKDVSAATVADPEGLATFKAAKPMRKSKRQQTKRSNTPHLDATLGRSWHDGLLILWPGARLVVQFEGHAGEFYELSYLSPAAGLELFLLDGVMSEDGEVQNMEVAATAVAA